jgi:hypothetical protein
MILGIRFLRLKRRRTGGLLANGDRVDVNRRRKHAFYAPLLARNDILQYLS